MKSFSACGAERGQTDKVLLRGLAASHATVIGPQELLARVGQVAREVGGRYEEKAEG